MSLPFLLWFRFLVVLRNFVILHLSYSVRTWHVIVVPCFICRHFEMKFSRRIFDLSATQNIQQTRVDMNTFAKNWDILKNWCRTTTSWSAEAVTIFRIIFRLLGATPQTVLLSLPVSIFSKKQFRFAIKQFQHSYPVTFQCFFTVIVLILS